MQVRKVLYRLMDWSIWLWYWFVAQLWLGRTFLLWRILDKMGKVSQIWLEKLKMGNKIVMRLQILIQLCKILQFLSFLLPRLLLALKIPILRINLLFPRSKVKIQIRLNLFHNIWLQHWNQSLPSPMSYLKLFQKVKKQ